MTRDVKPEKIPTNRDKGNKNEAPAVRIPPGPVFCLPSGLHRGKSSRTFNFITLVLLILNPTARSPVAG